MGLTKVEQLAARHLARSHYSDTRDPRPKSTIGQLALALEAKAPGVVERERQRWDIERDEARFEGNVPDWAKRLVRKYAGSRVTLRIRRSRSKPYSSGHCSYWDHRLVVTLGGTDENEHRYVVLHEIAHTIALHGHGDDFYDELYRMVRAEGLYRWCVSKKHAHWGSQGLRAAARRERAKGAA